MQRALDLIHATHGKVEVGHVHVFAQLYALQPGPQLQGILEMQHFHLTCITITIRHTDWWYWESDDPLRIASTFVETCRFPSSLTTLRMELESLERRKNQIDFIAAEMRAKWEFMRQDDVLLSAKTQPLDVTRWTGSSTWHGSRWIRDENRPEELDYYVVTVLFRPLSDSAPMRRQRILPEQLAVRDAKRFQVRQAQIRVNDLRQAGVEHGTPKEEALSRLLQWHEEQQQERASRVNRARFGRRRG